VRINIIANGGKVVNKNYRLILYLLRLAGCHTK